MREVAKVIKSNLSKMLRALTGAVALCVLGCLAFDPAGAETIRGHSTSGSRPRGGGSHSGHGGYGGYGGHWRGGFYGSYYNGYYGPGYYPYGYSYGYYPSAIAYIDTDVSPEDAAVYLDGEYVGTVDDFDGFPRYLPVEPGKHRITFKADGYKTLTRNLRVPRGGVLQIDFTMPEGTGSVEPEDASDDEDREVSLDEFDDDEAAEDEEDRYEQSESSDRSADPGFVRLTITPPDASVYVDGELLGSASHFSRLHGDLRFESGSHRIEVVRPGYRGITRVVDVKPGDRLTLRFDLEPDDTRRESPR